MATLAFVKQHNMVAYLEKTEENADFHQILDFLASSSINFALTISPTIYASYIEQFWNTACLKTIEKQIHANVDGKAVVVSESSVMRDLYLNDEDGIACLTTNAIFINLALVGYAPASDKLTFYKVVVGEGSEQPPEPQPTPSTAPLEVLSQVTTAAASQPLKDPKTYRRTKRGRNTKVPQSGGSPNKVGSKAINRDMLDSVERAATTTSSLEAEQASGGHTLGSGEDSMEHQIELTDNVPNTPHDSPLLGVNTPGSDKGSLELNELMDLVTKLSHRVFDLEKVKIAQQKRLMTQGKIGTDDAEVVKGSGDIEVLDTEKAVNTAGEGVSIASVPENTLIKMKEEKAKEKGVVITDVEDSSKPVRSITTLQPLPTIDPKDKDKELRVERERQKEASKIAIAEMFDEVQARIDADYELAARITQEKQEKYTIKERARYWQNSLKGERNS
ncbi:hypothetical protein Tco_0103482 [Tanacetum coccineum]